MAKSNKSFWMSDEDQKGDFSNDKRDTFKPEKGYIGVRLQQGVPLLDRDWNELEDIRRYQEVSLRKNYIGDGTPDDGFRIKPSDIENDFLITRGRYLVEGLEADSTHIAVNGTDPDDLKKDISFKKLYPNIALTAPSTGTSRNDAVYLEVTISEIGPDDDPDLKNAGDINMATCLRHKLKWAVKVAEGADMPASEQFVHRSLLATIARKGSVIKAEEITNKRSKIRTFLPGDEGRMIVNGPLDVTGGLFVEDGNVGIGTASPGAKLHVVGSSQDANGNTLILGLEKGSNLRLGCHSDYSWIQSHASKPLAINPVGNNVGIGTTTPGAKLHVAGDILANGSLWSRTLVGLQTPAGASKWHISYGYEGLNFAQTGVADGRLFLKDGGNVGIGTTDPKARLHVAAADDPGADVLKVDGLATFNRPIIVNAGVSFIRMDGGSKSASWHVNQGAGEKAGLNFAETAPNTVNARIFIKPGGNVGIGTIDPGAKLHVAGDLKVTGNVGIGTDSPAGKLDVAGDIRAGNSDIYFTKTDHNHTGIGNTEGYAAIENASDYGALMILGRATKEGRQVQIWDDLYVNRALHTGGAATISGLLTVQKGLKFNGWIDFGGRDKFENNVVMGCWGSKEGLWFGIFFEGKLCSYCNLNTGDWRGAKGDKISISFPPPQI